MVTAIHLLLKLLLLQKKSHLMTSCHGKYINLLHAILFQWLLYSFFLIYAVNYIYTVHMILIIRVSSPDSFIPVVRFSLAIFVAWKKPLFDPLKFLQAEQTLRCLRVDILGENGSDGRKGIFDIPQANVMVLRLLHCTGGIHTWNFKHRHFQICSFSFYNVYRVT